MTDELDILRKAYKADGAPEPRTERRKAAIEAAMARFGEENSKAVQGKRAEARHSSRGSSIINFILGKSTMSTSAYPRLSYMLAGGASLAVLAIVSINTGMLFHEAGLPGSREREQVTEQPETSAAPEVAQAPQEEPAKLKSEDKEADLADAMTGGNAGQRVDDLAKAPSVAGGGGKLLSFRNNEKRAEQQAIARNFVQGQNIPQPMQSAPPAPAPVEGFAQIAPSSIPAAKQDQGQGSYYEDQGRDKFAEIEQNPVKLTTEEPVSTFSIDVDTASYAFMRSSLNQGVLPHKDSVRVEELINYFPYDYAAPDDKAVPFKAGVSVMPSPWNTSTKLIHIGIKGYEVPRLEKPRSNLVFLIDTSGSMNSPDKLPLLKNSFRLLLDTLGERDTVSIVVYAGSAGTVLEPTKASDKAKILAALDNLQAGGSTAGGEGIRQAYQLAESNFDKQGVNRVILATDGDFNVGISSTEELKGFIERKRDTGVYLSVLGFGRGNYNDELMQALAQNGNGNAAYIDTLNEARKVLVEEAGSTIIPIATDVKIQVEFNPTTVQEYRLIGYETRILNREDFNNDKVDAGDIGSGHTVTAIYEIVPVGQKGLVDGLRYGQQAAPGASGQSDEYAFLKIRYKLPGESVSKLIETPIGKASEAQTVDTAPQESRFAAAVAGFGQLLTGGRYTGTYAYDDVIALAAASRGNDSYGYRSEFLNMVRLAKSAAALEQQK